MRRLVAALVIVVTISTIALAQSPAAGHEKLLMLQWQAKTEHFLYQFYIEPEGDGAKYKGVITDIDGHVSVHPGRVLHTEWKEFEKKVLSYDPFTMQQGKVTNPRATVFALAVRSTQNNMSVQFVYPPDAAHRKLITYLQKSWPGRIEDKMRGIRHYNHD